MAPLSTEDRPYAIVGPKVRATVRDNVATIEASTPSPQLTVLVFGDGDGPTPAGSRPMFLELRAEGD